MVAAFTELTAGTSNSDLASYPTASVTLTAGRLYLLGVLDLHGTAAIDPTSVVTGTTSLAFAKATSVAFFSVLKVGLWWVIPATTITETIVMAYGATQTGQRWSLVEVTGAHATAPILQTIPAASGGNVTSQAAVLASAIIAGNARFSVGALNQTGAITISGGTGTWTPGTNESQTGPSAAMRTAWDAAPITTDTTATWTGASGRFGVIHAEIAVAALAGGDSVGMIPS